MGSDQFYTLNYEEPEKGTGVTMWGFIIFLLLMWAALSIVGFVIKGFLWLAFLGIALFAVTAIWGFLKRKIAD